MGELIREQPLKITDVSARFNVHRRTVERWFRTGLEHYYLGGTPYTTLDALARFARVPAATSPAAPVVELSEAQQAHDRLVSRYGMGSFAT